MAYEQQLGLTFRTPVAVTATNARTGNPAANAALVTKWRRTVRSLTATDGWRLVYDFGSAVALDGVYLNGCNFSQVMLSRSSDGGTFTNLYAGNQTLPLDTACAPPPRRKGWFPASAFTSAFNHRYLGVQAYTVDGGAGYFEIGACACPVIENMTRNFGAPFTVQPLEAVTRLSYAGGGGSEVNVEAPTRVTFNLQGGPWIKAALAQLMRLRGLGQDAPFFLYLNQGDLAEAYILKRIADPAFARRFATFDADWQFEECM